MKKYRQRTTIRIDARHCRRRAKYLALDERREAVRERAQKRESSHAVAPR